MNSEEITEMKIMKEVGVDLEKGSNKKILEGMTEVATVDLNQFKSQYEER